jgi:hypothetical protein
VKLGDASSQIDLSLGEMVQSVDLSSSCELLCYLIEPVGIERKMLLDLHNSRKRILVQPHRIDGLLSFSGNAVAIATAFIGTLGCVISSVPTGKNQRPHLESHTMRCWVGKKAIDGTAERTELANT